MFHQNANPLALGMNLITNIYFSDTNKLVSKKSRGPNMNPNQPNANPIASRWNMIILGNFRVLFGLGIYACQFHFVFLYFVCVAKAKEVSHYVSHKHIERL